MTRTAQNAGAFLTDVRNLRRRARVHMKRGPVTERGIDFYGELIRYFGNDDPTSRRLIEEILAQEEGHAEDLKALIVTLRCGDHQ